jgi:hypothetical protein
MPHKFVGNTVERESMKLFGARANELSTDLALKNPARNILRSRLNLLIDVRHSLHVVQFSRVFRIRSTMSFSDDLAKLRRFEPLVGSPARCANDWDR